MIKSGRPADLYYYYTEDGARISFELIGSEYRAMSDKGASLVKHNGTEGSLLLTHADGKREFFSTDGRLSRIEHLDGRYIDVAWSGSMATVTDLFGNSLTIEDTGEQISFIFPDDTGAAVTRQESMITEVAYLGVSGEQLSSVAYRYDDDTFPHALTGFIDERGIQYGVWSYDQSGRASYTAHGSADTNGDRAEQYRFTFGASSTTVTNPLGKESTSHFTTVSGKRRITRVEGHASSGCAASSRYRTYDGNGFRDKVADDKGQVTDYDYSSLGLLEKKTEGLLWADASRTGTANTDVTRATEYVWDTVTRQRLETRAPGLTTRYEYWPDKRLRRVTRTDTTQHTNTFGTTEGQQRSSEYDYTFYSDPSFLAGTLVQTLRVNGPLPGDDDITLYQYSPKGELLSVTNPAGHITHYADYNGRGQPGRITDPNGVVTEMVYHPRGWLTQVIRRSPDGDTTKDATTRYDWYLNGTLEQVTFANGSYLQYEYNDARQLTQVRNNLGESIAYSPNRMGDWVRAETHDASGTTRRLQRRAFDELGRLRNLFGNNGQHTEYGYDLNNNPSEVIEHGTSREITTAIQRDVLDRLAATLKPAYTEQDGDAVLTSIETRYQYDTANNLAVVTDPNGNNTRYTHNGFGESIRVASPDSGSTDYWYDELGNMVAKQDAEGVIVHYHYDAMSRLQWVAYPDNTLDVRYFYDEVAADNPYARGRLTRIVEPNSAIAYRYDYNGNVIEDRRTINGVTHITGYGYDNMDRLVRITYPSGRQTALQRDGGTGRISAVTAAIEGQSPQDVASQIRYLPFGPAWRVVYGNGITRQLTFDQDYRLQRILDNGIATIKDRQHGYDSFDNITAIFDNLLPQRDQSFLYDDLHRLQRAEGDYIGTDTLLRYEYDPVGNRVRAARARGGDITELQEYSYAPGSNRLIEAGATQYQYDARGNVVHAGELDYHYNDRNRLASVSRSGELLAVYTHNALGQRISKRLSGVSEEEVQRHLRLAGEARTAADALGAERNQLLVQINAWREEQVLLDGRAVQLEGQADTALAQAEELTTAAQQQQRLADAARMNAEVYRTQAADYLARRRDGLIGWLINWWYERQARRADAMAEQALAEAAQREAEAADLLAQAEASQNAAGSLRQEAASARQQADQLALNITEQQLALQVLQDDIAHQLALADYHQQQADNPSQQEQTLHFVYSLTGELLGEYAEDGTPIREYIHANGAPLAMINYSAREIGEDGALHAEVYWYHTDHLSTPQALTNRTGQVVWQAQYDPFGEVVVAVSAVSQPLRFPGQYFDEETGLHYNWNRYMDPMTGRFTSFDPLGLYDGPNGYVYVHNNPVNYYDPFGLDTYVINRTLGGNTSTSKNNPLSHTYTATTDSSGKVDNTYSWGNTYYDGKTGWTQNHPDDMKAAQESIDNGQAQRIGSDLLDPYVQSAFDELMKDPNEPWALWDNCKHKTADLLGSAIDKMACDCP